MHIWNAVGYLSIILCIFGIGREVFNSFRQRKFSPPAAGWIMFYLGIAVMAMQRIAFPKATSPGAATAYSEGGQIMLVVGILMVLATKFLPSRDTLGHTANAESHR